MASYHTNGAYVATNNYFSIRHHQRTVDRDVNRQRRPSYGGNSTNGDLPVEHLRRLELLGRCGVHRLEQAAEAATQRQRLCPTPADATEKGGIANGSGGSAATGNVLTNDTDPDAGDTKTVTAISFGSTAGTLCAALNGARGSLTINASGVFTYTINENDAAVQALRLSTNTLTDAFTYTMRDTAGAKLHGDPARSPSMAPMTHRHRRHKPSTRMPSSAAFSPALPAAVADVDDGRCARLFGNPCQWFRPPSWLRRSTRLTRAFSGTPTARRHGRHAPSIRAAATDLGGLARQRDLQHRRDVGSTTADDGEPVQRGKHAIALTSLNDGTLARDSA